METIKKLRNVKDWTIAMVSGQTTPSAALKMRPTLVGLVPRVECAFVPFPKTVPKLKKRSLIVMSRVLGNGVNGASSPSVQQHVVVMQTSNEHEFAHLDWSARVTVSTVWRVI